MLLFLSSFLDHLSFTVFLSFFFSSFRPPAPGRAGKPELGTAFQLWNITGLIFPTVTALVPGIGLPTALAVAQVTGYNLVKLQKKISEKISCVIDMTGQRPNTTRHDDKTC